MRKVVLLFTPGMDSYLANFFLTIKSKEDNFELVRLYFDLRSRYSEDEKSLLDQWYGDESATETIHVSNAINISYAETADGHVYNRNLLLTTMASALYPESETIIINGMKDDRVCDNKKEFFDLFSLTLTQSIEHPINILSIFWDNEKTEAIKKYLELGGPRFDLLNKTYSCFTSNEVSRYKPTKNTMIYEMDDKTGSFKKLGYFSINGCLKCPACFRRLCALTAANIYVPFNDMNLVIKYNEPGYIDKNIHPNRYESLVKYTKFLQYLIDGE